MTQILETELTVGPKAIDAYSRLSYTMWFALAEFVDNSTQSRLNYGNVIDEVLRDEGRPLIVSIVHDRPNRTLTIGDDLVAALRIAQPTPDSKGRSKYGMGMPFELRNIVFDLEDDRQAEYDKLSNAIARSISQHGAEAAETIALFLKRARVLNLSLNRIRLALKLMATNRSKRTLIFHEDIAACNLIHSVLAENSVKAGVYHSKMTLRDRAVMLGHYRRGEIDVLVTCRALDEGFNVPETELGIIAASTATRRQRIQRLGRVVRPAKGKMGALIYTLVATGPEIQRLKEEEAQLENVATVTWSRA